jgi:hypothetical protein
MTNLGSAIVSVLDENGWTVTPGDEIEAMGLSFDFICESQAAVVFGKGVLADQLEARTRLLSAEVASVTQRRSVGFKTWEGYLLLLVTGDITEHERAIQSVQHDLAYCRKIVIPDVEASQESDLNAIAERFVAFLLPLRTVGQVQYADVRQALAERLEANSIDGELARDLVGHFDEKSCRCGERLKEFSRNQEPE